MSRLSLSHTCVAWDERDQRIIDATRKQWRNRTGKGKDKGKGKGAYT